MQTRSKGCRSADATKLEGGISARGSGGNLLGDVEMNAVRTTHRILVGDSHLLFREALRAALGATTGYEVVAEAQDGSWAVREARRTDPDIAILGSDINEWDAPRVTQMILDSVPSCRILWVASEENPSLLLNALSAGASGFITRTGSFDDLVLAIRSVHRGQVTFPRTMLPPLMDMLAGTQRARNEALAKVLSLTKRERQVLAHLAGGGDNEAIAKTLRISTETVRTHVQRILNKLDVHTRLGAAVTFLDADIFENP
jgi:two-component system nitrate/nitrite response regulator NarL